MADYEKMYHVLFNAITDSLDCFFAKDLEGGVARLIEAQRNTEDLYLEETENGG